MAQSKQSEYFTPEEFVTALTEWRAEAKAYRESNKPGDCTQCPVCIITRITNSTRDSTAGNELGKFVRECCIAADPVNFILHGGEPSREMLMVVCNALLLGMRLERAHAENRLLQQMVDTDGMGGAGRNPK